MGVCLNSHQFHRIVSTPSLRVPTNHAAKGRSCSVHKVPVRYAQTNHAGARVGRWAEMACPSARRVTPPSPSIRQQVWLACQQLCYTEKAPNAWHCRGTRKTAIVPAIVLHGESSKRLAAPRNTKDKKHLQSTQSAQPTNLTDQAPSTTERTARECSTPSNCVLRPGRSFSHACLHAGAARIAMCCVERQSMHVTVLVLQRGSHLCASGLIQCDRKRQRTRETMLKWYAH